MPCRIAKRRDQREVHIKSNFRRIGSCRNHSFRKITKTDSETIKFSFPFTTRYHKAIAGEGASFTRPFTRTSTIKDLLYFNSNTLSRFIQSPKAEIAYTGWADFIISFDNLIVFLTGFRGTVSKAFMIVKTESTAALRILSLLSPG